MGSLGISGIVRITSDAEISKTKFGNYYSFGIAAYRKYKKEGKQDVDFFDASIFVKNPAPGTESNFKKGNLIYIAGGYLFNDKFTSSDGKQMSKYKITISAYDILNEDTFSKKTSDTETKKVSVAPEIKKKPPVKEEIIPDPEEEDPSVDESEPPF